MALILGKEYCKVDSNGRFKFPIALKRQLETEDRELLRKLTDGNVIELDSNDRLLIPPEQKGAVAGAKEVVLQSTGKFIELWDRKAYDRMNSTTGDFAQRAEALPGQTTAEQ